MTVHRLHAGDGYTYLTNQVACGDQHKHRGQDLSDYYAQGETPGRWMGSGLAELGVEGQVSEAQMKALFGEGLHPDADRLIAERVALYVAAGDSPEKAAQAAVADTRLGRRFPRPAEDKLASAWRDRIEVLEVAEASRQGLSSRAELTDETRVQLRRNAARDVAQRAAKTPLTGSEVTAWMAARTPRDVAWREALAVAETAEATRLGLGNRTRLSVAHKARVRLQVGRHLFAEDKGRAPNHPGELEAWIGQQTKPARQAVAGFDLVFTPVKSVSVLWGLGDDDIRQAVQDAHETAVKRALAYVETHAGFTRAGAGGVAQLDTKGLIVAAFDHRDSRSGDMNIHTHAAVSNKVMGSDGKWRALDGRQLYAIGVSASEAYNTFVEDELRARLGVDFAARAGTPVDKQPVREVVGIDPKLVKHFSRRRAVIEGEYERLAAEYRKRWGHEPPRDVQIRLAQQATLATRPDKASGRSLHEQRTAWLAEAADVLAVSGDDVRAAVRAATTLSAASQTAMAGPVTTAAVTLTEGVKATAPDMTGPDPAPLAAPDMASELASDTTPPPVSAMSADMSAPTPSPVTAPVSAPRAGADTAAIHPSPVAIEQVAESVPGSRTARAGVALDTVMSAPGHDVTGVSGGSAGTPAAGSGDAATVAGPGSVPPADGGEFDGSRSRIDQVEQRAGHLLADPLLMAEMADRVRSGIEDKRATWTRWNVRAEVQRATRTWTVETPSERDRLVDVVTEYVLTGSVRLALDPTETARPDELTRASDGQSVYVQHGADRYTSTRILAAEDRLVGAARTPAERPVGRLRFAATVAAAKASAAMKGRSLDPAQVELARAFACSDRQLVAGIGPAGTGKTTSMRLVVDAVHRQGGRVIGLAPSARAAAVLGAELGIPARTMHSWLLQAEAAEDDPRRLQLGPGDVVLVDEAGMAGTLRLDAVRAVAAERGAVVRLLGDPMQLAAVESGGALRLIDREVGAAKLTEVYRFLDPAEAEATLQLREGAEGAWDWHQAAGRIHGGAADDVRDAAYEAWQADVADGKVSLLLSSSNAQVRELSARAREDRIAAGLVDGSRAVDLLDDTQASVGDVIVTRANNRDLPLLGGKDFVKNGDLWAVEELRVPAAGEDGQRLEGHDLVVRHLGHGGRVVLPAAYVAEAVQLGYASTIHRAQGMTVDTAHLLLDETTTREAAYVGLTRGRHTNHVYVPTSQLLDPDVHTPPAPELALDDVLEAVLRREGAEKSATETWQTVLEDSVSLAGNAPQYMHALGVYGEARLQLAETAQRVLADVAPDITTADAWPVLAGSLSAAHLATGRPVADLLTEAVATRPLDDARSPAVVLGWRLDHLTARAADARNDGLPFWLPAPPRPAGASGDAEVDELVAWLQQRADKLARRLNDLVDVALVEQPAWAARLLDHPEALRAVAAYRDAHGITTTDPDLPLGLQPRHGAAGELWRDTMRRAGLSIEDEAPGAGASSRPDGSRPGARPDGPRRGGTALLDQAAPQGLDVSPDLVAAARAVLGEDITTTPSWPVLAVALARASDRTGRPAPDVLTDALQQRELGTAADSGVVLAWRLDHLTTTRTGLDSAESPDPRPATGVNGPVDVDAPPASAPTAEDVARAVLPPSLAEQVLTDPAWLDLAEGLDRIRAAGYDPAAALEVAAADAAAHGLPGDVTELAIAVDAWAYVRSAAVDIAPPAWPQLSPAAHAETVTPQAAPGAAPGRTTTDATTAAPPARIGDVDQVDVAALHDVLDRATAYYAAQEQPAWVADYLAARGLTSTDLPTGTGYAPASWTGLVDHLRAAGITEETMLAAGVATRTSTARTIDRFRDRLVIPVRDAHGDVITFTGRAAPDAGDDVPKWLNGPSTDLYDKSTVLYGLGDSRAALQAAAVPVLAEGPLDVAAINRAGAGHYVGVAGLGTALTPAHIDALADVVDLPSQDVLVAYDADGAGRKAAARAYDLLAARTTLTRGVQLPDGHDPADTLGQHGAPALGRALDEAVPLVDVVIEQRITERLRHGDHVEARVAALRDVAPLIATLPPDQSAARAAALADRLDIAPTTVMLAVVDELPHAVARMAPPPAARQEPTEPEPKPNRDGVREQVRADLVRRGLMPPAATAAEGVPAAGNSAEPTHRSDLEDLLRAASQAASRGPVTDEDKTSPAAAAAGPTKKLRRHSDDHDVLDDDRDRERGARRDGRDVGPGRGGRGPAL